MRHMLHGIQQNQNFDKEEGFIMMWNFMICLHLENVPDQHTKQNLVGQIFQLIPPHLCKKSD